MTFAFNANGYLFLADRGMSDRHRPQRGSGDGHVLRRDTVGRAWLAAAESILSSGAASSWDGEPMLEVLQLTLVVDHPQPTDPIIERFASAERLAWMHTNFHDHTRVAELGDADSYATRLYDYAHSGMNQLAWVVDRLHDEPLTRNATITTFQPLTDTSYIPCVSLLDFWINHGALQLAVYAHGIDFGTKGNANLIELAHIQHRVANELSTPVGALTFIIKSAHIYNTEVDAMRAINAASQLAPWTPSVARTPAR